MDKNCHKPELLAEFTILDKDGNVKSQDSENYNIPGMEYTLDLEVRNPDGTVDQHVKVPFRSFVANFAHILNYAFAAVANSTLIKLTSGSNPAADIFIADCEAASTADTNGIFIGTNSVAAASPGGATNVAYGDFNLRSKIAHGTSAGQMEYGACTASAWVLGGSSFTFTRTFINSSGASIIVKEVGLVGASSTDYTLVARDTLDPSSTTTTLVDLAVTVATGQTLSVTYTIGTGTGYTYNWLGLVYSLLTASAATILGMVAGGAVSTNFSSDVTYCRCNPAAATTTHGIIVGTSAGPRSNLSLITQNTTLTHSAHTTFATEAATSTGVSVITTYYAQSYLQRDFTNETGALVTVRETGLAAAGNSVKTLLANVAPTTQYALQNLETLRVKFTLRYPVTRRLSAEQAEVNPID